MMPGDKSKYINMGLEEPDYKFYTCEKCHTWKALGTYIQGIFEPEKYQDICPECKEEGWRV